MAPIALTVRVIVVPAPKLVMEVLAIAEEMLAQDMEITNAEASLLTMGIKEPFKVTIRSLRAGMRSGTMEYIAAVGKTYHD